METVWYMYNKGIHPITNSIFNSIFLCISENNSSKQQLHISNTCIIEGLLNEGSYNFKLNYSVHFNYNERYTIIIP